MPPLSARFEPEDPGVAPRPGPGMVQLPPEACMMLSMVLPGAGHAALGLWRTAIFTAIGFIVSLVAVVVMAAGGVDALDPAINERFFTVLWIAVAVWFFAIGDAWHAARDPDRPWPNPRIAFVLNFCTRGLGYFYVERPWAGGIAIVTWAAVIHYAERFGISTLMIGTVLVQAAMGLHAYALALRRHDPQQVAARLRSERRGTRLRRVFTPAAIVVVASALAMQAVSAAVQTMDATRARASSGTRQHGQLVHLDSEGLSFTLPTADWSYEPAQEGNSVGSFVSPRAHLVLLSVQPCQGGVDGFIVDLAGELAADHGNVRLRDQRRLACGDGLARELSLQWVADGMLEWSHVFLIPHRDRLHTLIVAFPARLDGRNREEVESLIRSFRFND